jgi:hypothetical protein
MPKPFEGCQKFSVLRDTGTSGILASFKFRPQSRMPILFNSIDYKGDKLKGGL